MQDMRAINAYQKYSYSTWFPNYDPFTVFRKSEKGQHLEGEKVSHICAGSPYALSSTSYKSNKLFLLKIRVDIGTEKKDFPFILRDITV